MRLKSHIFVISIIVILIFGIAQSINYSYAQENGESLIVSSSFQMIEFSEDYGTIENSSLVSIDLLSSNWILTDIDLNFTGIKMNYEIKVIEEEATGFEMIRGSYNEILGMQINITEPTIIYSVDIFGYKAIKTTTHHPYMSE